MNKRSPLKRLKISMKRILRKLKSSGSLRDLIVILSLALFAYIVADYVDLFEIVAEKIEKGHGWQLDEVVIVLISLCFTFALFSIRRNRELRADIRKRARRVER